MGPFARALIEGSALLSLPLISLGIFTVTFAGILARTWRTRPEVIDTVSRLPLEDTEREVERR